MNGDFTKVPLRRVERWNGARMQQGRVLLDHEWNLNLDAAARTVEAAVVDAIGAAGVPAGSAAFEISFVGGKLTVHPGRIWVDGLLAFAPHEFAYADQDPIDPLPAPGPTLVYLDVFVEHLQPAEGWFEESDPFVDPAQPPQPWLEILDPALANVDAASRTRVGYRVRVASTAAATCSAAFAALAPAAESTGTMTIKRVAAPPGDPCAPPGDPRGRLPDGLFRVEVLDAGDETSARFAWSYENGAAAVAVTSVAGNVVTLRPSPSVKFATGELVEVSWLARRADRKDHGPLYKVGPVTTGAAGDSLTLDRAVTLPTKADGTTDTAPPGLVLRRWDGEDVGAAAAVDAKLRGVDLGVRFQAAAGRYEAGDWWGAMLREEQGAGIEFRTNAPPDGIKHSFAPLALVDLAGPAVEHDCRPKFHPLVGLECDAGACTVSVKPGDDLQTAVDSLPADGGEVCFAAGLYELSSPVFVDNRRRVVFHGAGPASVLRAVGREPAAVFRSSTEVEVRQLRIEGGSRGAPPGDVHLNGAVTFVACSDVVVSDCVVTCADSTGKTQTCVTVRSDPRLGKPDRIRIEGNHLLVGSWQTGILVVDPAHVLVARNTVELAAGSGGRLVDFEHVFLRETHRLIAASVRKVAGQPSPSALEIAPGAPGSALAKDFLRIADASIEKLGPENAIRKFARGIVAERVVGLSPSSLALLAGLRQELRAGLAGIVVGGAIIGTVQVLDNVVEGVVQSIHIGASDAHQAGREQADEVVVSHNVIHALVPSSYDRDRHGIFVGNARSIHIVDTNATLTRPGKPTPRATPVEGIRVHGVLGRFLTVRQTSLRGFQVGVRVKPLPEKKGQMWLVAELMADGASQALDAPGVVDRQRIFS